MIDWIILAIAVAGLLLGIFNRWYTKAKADGDVTWSDVSKIVEVLSGDEKAIEEVTQRIKKKLGK